jgi:hypothetical protein
MLTDPRKKKGVMASNGEILKNPTKKAGGYGIKSDGCKKYTKIRP